MQHHGVDAVIHTQTGCRGPHGQFHQPVHLLMGANDLGLRVQRRGIQRHRLLGGYHRGLQGLRGGRIQPGQQFLRAITAHTHRGQHGHAQLTGQHLTVNLNAPALGHVAHVQHQHHGQAQGPGFQHQAQVQAQVGGIGHAHQQVGQRLAGAAATHDVTGDGFIQAVRVQAVGTG